MSNLYILSDRNAAEMKPYEYDNEYTLQKLVEANPSMLLRDDEALTTKLYLIGSEVGVSYMTDNDSSFSIDHLMITSDGVPVIVEDKLKSNIAIKRMIVGQILDYASRLSSIDINELRARFEYNNKQAGEEVRALAENDDFWQTAERNIKSNRMKLVFVADSIPDSLGIIIEFLDRNFPSIEVYGVEIRRYLSGETTLLSINHIGNSLSKVEKVAKKSKSWDAKSFREFLVANDAGDRIPIIDSIFSLSESMGISVSFGKGAVYPSAIFRKNDVKLMYIWSTDINSAYINIPVDSIAKATERTPDDIVAAMPEVEGRSRTKHHLYYYRINQLASKELQAQVLKSLLSFFDVPLLVNEINKI